MSLHDGIGLQQSPLRPAPLLIRPAQFSVLEAQRDQDLHESLVRHLILHFPETRELSKGELSSRVARVVERARSHYGLESAQAVCRYLNFCAALGWDFDLGESGTEIRAMLTDRSVSSPDARLYRLVEQYIYRERLRLRNRQVRNAAIAR